VGLASGRGGGHGAADLAEDGAEAGGNCWHDGGGGNRYKTRHQGVFDEVLAAGFFPNSQFPSQINNPCHVPIPLVLSKSWNQAA
jgi:hypothetical protein